MRTLLAAIVGFIAGGTAVHTFSAMVAGAPPDYDSVGPPELTGPTAGSPPTIPSPVIGHGDPKPAPAAPVPASSDGLSADRDTGADVSAAGLAANLVASAPTSAANPALPPLPTPGGSASDRAEIMGSISRTDTAMSVFDGLHQKMWVGVRLDEEKLLRGFQEIVGTRKDEFSHFPQSKEAVGPGGHPIWSWYGKNGMFMAMDANLAHSMVRHFKPRRVVEIGSGMSTRVTCNAMLMNERSDGIHNAQLTVIEPFPTRLPQKIQNREVFQDVSAQLTFKQEFVEDSVLATFTALQDNDILFIDSSHFVGVHADAYMKGKEGHLFTDVIIEFTELVPRLNPGVVVHVHDIPFPAHAWFNSRKDPDLAKWPQEPRDYIEQFMLHALLAFNPYLEVIHFGGIYAEHWALAMGWSLTKTARFKDEARKVLDPKYGGVSNFQTPYAYGGSVWFRRTNKEYPTALDPLLTEFDVSKRDSLTLRELLNRHRSWVGWRRCASNLRPSLGTGTEPRQVEVLKELLRRQRPQNILLVGESSLNRVALDSGATVETVSKAEVVNFGQILKLAPGEFVIYSVSVDAAGNKYHPGLIVFVTEILPRLPAGVMVVVRGIAYPQHVGLDGDQPYSSQSGQFLLQAFGVHNSEFELVWAEGEEQTAPTIAAPAHQCIIIRRNMIGDPNYELHNYDNAYGA
eukprot:SAG31_NODE_4892_length_2880_cov_2.219626_1_plen_684_part_00